VPDSNWSPDLSWPPPPPGWPLWVDDWLLPPHQPPRATSQKALWTALVVVAVVILVASSVFAVSAVRKTASAGESKTSGKPDIIQLTRDLLVDKSAFPEFDGARRSSGLGTGDGKGPGMSNLSVDPQECADLYGYAKSATQAAYATVSKLGPGGPRSMEVHLAITPEQSDLRDDVDKCRSFTVSSQIAGRTMSVETQLDPLHAPGAPPWAVATEMKSSSSPLPGIPLSLSVTTASVSGYYRGVLVVAGYHQFNRRTDDGASVAPGVINDLVKLFNAQVEKLEAAP
jgi:hypothetical protein